MKKYLFIIGIFLIICQFNVTAISLQGNVTVQWTVHNWTSGNSSSKSLRWIESEGGLYKTYGGSGDTWGLSNLVGSNFSNGSFQLALKSAAINVEGSDVIAVDHVQIRVYYYTIPNVTLVSPTPANNSIIGSTMRINYTTSEAGNTCYFQSNRSGSWVNESIISGGTSCNLYYYITGLNNGTFQYNQVVITSDATGVSETRNVSVQNVPSQVNLTLPLNNTISTNTSWILNWSINNTQNDEVILRGFIAQNTTGNISKQMFYYGEGNLNNSYIYNFSSMQTPLNSSGLWALYKFDKNSDVGENGTKIVDYSQYSKNGTSTGLNYANGKFGRGLYHSYPTYLQEVTLLSNDFANVSVNGMSINAWINMTANNSYYTIATRFNTPYSRFFRLWYQVDKMTFDIYQNGNTTVCTSNFSGMQTGVYSMITATFNGSFTSIYKDGIQRGNTTCTFNGINQTAWQYSEPVYIGEQLTDTLNFEGTIDELGFWNRSLSSTEVSNLYNLQNDTYFWYVESNEYNISNKVNTSIWQFIKGGITDPCLCLGTSNCIIQGSDNCIYTTPINMNNNNFTCSNPGNVTFDTNMTNYDYLITFVGCEIRTLSGRYVTG